MNQNGIAPLIIVAIVVAVAVVAGVGVYAATRSGGGGNGGGTDISGASSLQFDVNSTIENLSNVFTFYTKNIGTSNVMIRIDGTVSGEDVIYIINGAQQKVWFYTAGTWIDLSSSYSTYWETWSQSLQSYQYDLVGWSGGSWTSPDGSTTISNIKVNPSLSDSLFEH
jgi:hypothetical protein